MLCQQTHVLHGRRLSTAGQTEAKFHTTAPCCSLRRCDDGCCSRSTGPEQVVQRPCRTWESRLHWPGRVYGDPHPRPFSRLLGTQLAGEAFWSFTPHLTLPRR